MAMATTAASPLQDQTSASSSASTIMAETSSEETQGSEAAVVVGEYSRWMEGAGAGDEAVAAVMALTAVVRSCDAADVEGLVAEINSAANVLKCLEKPYGSLSAACDMFVRYVAAKPDDDAGGGAAGFATKRRLVSRAKIFRDISLKARETVATLCQDFVPDDGGAILVHGRSPAVLAALKLAAANRKRFRVICTEGRPGGAGQRMAGELATACVPAMVLVDAAVAYAMGEVGVVLVGADVVAETGGVVGDVGTYQVALVARAMGKPVYVAAESYKFARLYPLGQKDVDQHGDDRPVDMGGVPVPAGVDVEAPARDYTPPEHLELLVTDVGVLQPAAVSEVLIQLSL
ncbi:hypothetical protein E2562_004922 [Oryza meyeriana var. granulata]|uniref:Translation initiation factor eIF2B subunit alpha n=1 Tax=Oryza meyeriana var. granulata TaxID=110450 RepID=A0A6G1C431_9ORYZ|nr:hypothetical protein E2562_004922 [Oryza meyeriana var. granulata]